MKTNPTESPKALVLPAVGHLGRGSERVQAQAAPARRTLEEWGSQWPALCPGPPEATLLRGLPPGLPPGPRAGPLPLLPNTQNLPPAWKPAPSGRRGLFILGPSVCPQRLRCPGAPPAELSLPRPCLPTAHRTPRPSGRSPPCRPCLWTSPRHSPTALPWKTLGSVSESVSPRRITMSCDPSTKLRMLLVGQMG